MKLLKISRTFGEGARNFTRNGLLTLATVSVMTLSLFLMSATAIIGLFGKSGLQSIEGQLNIGVYFNMDVSEERVLEIKSQLEEYREISRVDFVSRQEAFDRLLAMAKDNQNIKDAIDTIGENPLPHSLVIYAQAPELYESVNETLKSSAYASEIDDINYDRNKEDISRLYGMLTSMQKIGLSVGAAFLVVSVLIAYNAIRLSLYSQRREFEIMRLVGASNLYIKLPSIFEGMLYGLAASFATIVSLSIFLRYLATMLGQSFGTDVVVSTISMYWWMPVVTVPIAGILLGALSSWFAIRKHLKI
jgi:cell division transport system permease protein